MISQPEFQESGDYQYARCKFSLENFVVITPFGSVIVFQMQTPFPTFLIYIVNPWELTHKTVEMRIQLCVL